MIVASLHSWFAHRIVLYPRFVASLHLCFSSVNINGRIICINPCATENIISGASNHLFAVKLDRDNFLLWRQQVMAAIKGHGLQHFILNGKSSSPEFPTETNQECGQVNHAFISCQQEDQMLVC